MRQLCPDHPFGVNLTILPTMGAPLPYEEYARVIIEEGVKIVETAGSNPKTWVPLFKRAGACVLCVFVVCVVLCVLWGLCCVRRTHCECVC